MYCKVARFEFPADSSLPARGAISLVSRLSTLRGNVMPSSSRELWSVVYA